MQSLLHRRNDFFVSALFRQRITTEKGCVMAAKTKKLLLVADYGKDDLAFKEVTQRLYELAQKAGQRISIDIVSVDAFNTAQTAAVVAKAAEDGRYDIIYHNTAPRKDIKKARVNNDGEGLIFARHVSGGRETLIVGVNSGDEQTVNTSALLSPERVPDGIYHVKSDTRGSQFRSRDVFPPHVINALTGTIALENKPFQPPAPLDEDKVRSARADAEKLLADAYTRQLSRHGDASASYVTVVARRDTAAELVHENARRFHDAEIDLLPLKSDKNEWIEAGFAAAQLALNSEQPQKRTLVVLPGKNFHLDDATELFEARLDNGARILTSDLRSLIFAKGRIVEAQSNFTLQQLNEVAKLPADITPAYTDGYGNVKLAVRHAELLGRLGIGQQDGQIRIKAGERGVTSVQVGGKNSDAYVASGSFAVHDGEVALSKGSSGWPTRKGGEPGVENFAEIFLRGGNASKALDIPQPGDPVTIKLKTVQRGLPPGSVVDGDGLNADVERTQNISQGV
jgi:hypothetical protein